MSPTLEIQNDVDTSNEASPEAQAAEVTLESLPDYLAEEPEDGRGAMTLALLAVTVFLLTTVGPIAGMHFYLKPTLADTQDELAVSTTDLHRIDAEVEAEKMRGQEHERKLVKIEKSVLSPANDRQLDAVIAEVRGIAREVATSRAAEGGFVVLATLNISEDGSVALAGNVDSFLTLADWLERLEGSDYLKDLRFTSATSSNDIAKPNVPFALNLKLDTPPKRLTTEAPTTTDPIELEPLIPPTE